MRHVQRLAPFLALTVLLSSSAGQAINIPLGTDDVTLNIGVLLQTRAEGTWDGDFAFNAAPPSTTNAGDPSKSPSGHFNTDFYLRRARLIASGIGWKYFTYYIMLDTPRFGQRGSVSVPNGSVNTFVQDMYVGYQPIKDTHIELGFVYLPLSHNAMSSSSSTLALESVADILKYPNARGSREAGVQIRTLLFNDLILIRGGAYEGSRQVLAPAAGATPVNPQGSPLWAGMVRLNLIGSEPGYSYPSMYYDGKSRMSVGVGAQYQPHGGTATAGVFNDYIAGAADFFANLALPGDQEAALTIGGYRFDYGQAKANTGWGLHGEAGFRFGPIAPFVSTAWFNSDLKSSNFFKASGGITYHFRKQNAKIQAEFAAVTSGDPNLASNSAKHVATIQAQFAN